MNSCVVDIQYVNNKKKDKNCGGDIVTSTFLKRVLISGIIMNKHNLDTAASYVKEIVFHYPNQQVDCNDSSVTDNGTRKRISKNGRSVYVTTKSCQTTGGDGNADDDDEQTKKKRKLAILTFGNIELQANDFELSEALSNFDIIYTNSNFDVEYLKEYCCKTSDTPIIITNRFVAENIDC